jgi:AcrR family transcriptional regulator
VDIRVPLGQFFPPDGFRRNSLSLIAYAGLEVTENQRKNPTQDRAKSTVAAIVEAFTHIFARQGAKGANTNRIAEKAGVSIGSLYQYFPNKQAILVAAIRRLAHEKLEKLSQIRDGLEGKPLETAVAEMVDALIDLRARDQGFERVLIENLSQFKVLETIREAEADFVPLLTDCLARLGYREDRGSRAETAKFVYHTAFSLSVWVNYFGDKSLPLEKFKKEVTRLILGYLSNPC